MCTSLRKFFETSEKTQSDLADYCQVSQPTVSRWVAGRVPESCLPKVTRFTGIPAAELRPDLAKLFAPNKRSVRARASAACG